LQAIRTEVTDTGTGTARDADPTPDTDTADAAEMYACDKCRREVKATDRYDHALDAHKAPPEQAERMFTPV
jgi:hypothetical protein